jgi:KUP system potassium uptake protein
MSQPSEFNSSPETTVAAPAPAAEPGHPGKTTDAASHHHHGHGSEGPIALALGSIGVVYGDIGTSPLYAMRESLHHYSNGGPIDPAAIYGVISLFIWALTLVVTVKYVIFIMKADNRGEGGTLTLMALAQSVMGRTAFLPYALGIVGAALFYGDSIITPAISVLSAVEGLKYITPVFEPYILWISIAILIGLFAVQSRGTGKVAAFFGPIMLVWFLTLGGLGLYHIGDDLSIFAAFNPYYGLQFLFGHGILGLLVLGSVFLSVTGAEALYADMGHFGRFPIRLAWLAVIFPCLTLCYLGQGAMILAHPETAKDPFYMMVPEAWGLWGKAPLVIMATLATVIASQAVITGAFSLTQQAVRLGLLPRLEIRHTSETQLGQIYLPQINRMLLVGVLALVVLFQTSSKLANAYGIAVTGAMLADTALFFLVAWRVWKWNVGLVIGIVLPLFLIDLAFFGANALKIPDGAYMPLIFGALLIALIWTWVRGTGIVYRKEKRDSLPLADLIRMLEKSKPVRVPGTAVFLTSDPDTAPAALLHNLKHNKVLHKRNIMLTIKTAEVPRVPEIEQLKIEELTDDVKRIVATLGYMETPRVPHLLALARRRGLNFDIMQTSFFLGRRSIKPSANSGMPLWQDNLFIFLSREATNATDFFHIPSGRVVEMGSQVTV